MLLSNVKCTQVGKGTEKNATQHKEQAQPTGRKAVRRHLCENTHHIVAVFHARDIFQSHIHFTERL